MTVFPYFCWEGFFSACFEFNGPVNTIKVIWSWSVYLTTLFLGRLCLFVLRFYGPMGSCRVQSVYLTTRLLGRLSPLTHCILNRLSHTILEESNFNFRYVQLWDLHIPREKWLNYLQTAETLIRRRVLRRLIWVCTVYQLPFYGSPDYNALTSACAYSFTRNC